MANAFEQWEAWANRVRDAREGKRQHITDAAWERTKEGAGPLPDRENLEQWHADFGVMLVTVEEWDARVNDMQVPDG